MSRRYGPLSNHYRPDLAATIPFLRSCQAHTAPIRPSDHKCGDILLIGLWQAPIGETMRRKRNDLLVFLVCENGGSLQGKRIVSSPFT